MTDNQQTGQAMTTLEARLKLYLYEASGGIENDRPTRVVAPVEPLPELTQEQMAGHDDMAEWAALQ